MAAPVLARTIGVKCVDANIGEFVIVRNLTRGGQITGALKGETKNVVLNPATSLQWQEGDNLQAEIRGRLSGVKQKKISGGGVQMTIVGTVDTSTPGVSL